jgi:TRAP-type mannitol/chloroaromatic compound transport system permease small subunit
MAISEASGLSSGDSVLRKADTYLFKVESWCAYAAGLVIFLTMIIGVIQVIGRSVFNRPVPAYVDLIEIMMAVFAFLAISYAQRLGAHVRMEIVVKQFKGRTLWVAEVIGTLVTMWIITILMIYGYDHFLRAYEIGDSTIDGDYPLWPSKLIVPVAFALLLCRLTVNLFGFLRLVARPEAEPIGIPVIETVDDHAEREIRTSGLGEEAISDRSLRDRPGAR